MTATRAHNPTNEIQSEPESAISRLESLLREFAEEGFTGVCFIASIGRDGAVVVTPHLLELPKAEGVAASEQAEKRVESPESDSPTPDELAVAEMRFEVRQAVKKFAEGAYADS